MKRLLNDFLSLLFGEKEYTTIELVWGYGMLIIIGVILFIVRERI